MSLKFRPPEERIHSFSDAAAPVRLQWAVAEANRCLMCDDPPCQQGCLANVDIKKFIRALRTRNLRSAVATIREANFLVATCGRVCPQEELCEARCSTTDLARPIAIGELQRFVGETALAQKMKPAFPKPADRGRAAVVGGGPGGLSAAYYMRAAGIKVDIFERSDFLGGAMMSGIPGYRLPKDLLKAEIAPLLDDGVRIVCQEMTDVPALLREYGMIVLACGLGPARGVSLPGADLPGVWTADELLLTVNVRGEAPAFSGATVVLGGGSTAMDGAGVSRRLGSDPVIVAYRRSEIEMPAWMADREFVKEEGVEFRFLLAPIEFLPADSRVAAVRFQKNSLGEPDSSGRRQPVPIQGAFEEVSCRQVVLALGNAESPIAETLDLEMAAGRPKVDPVTMETSRPGLFAIGDLTSGGGTVVQAVADGRRAAVEIARRLAGASAPAH